MTIFEFTDYKLFLKLFLKNKKTLGRGTMARIAEHINVHPTFISQVLSGPKDFMEEQSLPIAEFIGLPPLEQEYFLILVQIERAGSKQLKNYFRQKRDNLRKESLKIEKRIEHQRQLSEEEKSKFYSSWTYSAVHLMTTLEGGVTFQKIHQRLKLEPKKVRQILDFLMHIGMVVEKDNTFLPGVQLTHIGRDSAFLVQHHTNWRVKAIEKVESLTDEELMYSVNVSLSEEDFIKLREMLVATIQQFIKTVQASPAKDVAQLNLDFFWI